MFLIIITQVLVSDHFCVYLVEIIFFFWKFLIKFNYSFFLWSILHIAKKSLDFRPQDKQNSRTVIFFRQSNISFVCEFTDESPYSFIRWKLFFLCFYQNFNHFLIKLVSENHSSSIKTRSLRKPYSWLFNWK